MAETTAPPIVLPRQRGSVTVRPGGLHEDLDALHEGDPLWWGKGIAQNGFAAGGVYVLPRARRRGVGRVVADVLADATAAYGLPGLADSVHALDEASLAASARLGYQVVGHHRESVLDLDTLDETASQTSVAQAEQAGFALRPLPDDADEAAWREVYDLAVETWRDAPDAEGSDEVLPYSVFRGFLPEPSYVLLAFRDGRPVGMTAVLDRAKDEALNTFFTGVRQGARGEGLATALKAQHALTMRARGHHRIFTQNMDQNAPILAANDRLGFSVVPGYYAVGRPVGSREGA
jgi:GNAT superfamily N-acetyltransferase